jgi:hypothetical protein
MFRRFSAGHVATLTAVTGTLLSPPAVPESRDAVRACGATEVTRSGASVDPGVWQAPFLEIPEITVRCSDGRTLTIDDRRYVAVSHAENPKEEPEARRFRPGDLVSWTPRDPGVASTVPLERNHPGRVTEPTSSWGVAVQWVDREGPLALEGEYDAESLTPVSAEEFDELSAAVREKRRAREARGRAEGRTYARRPAE